MNSHLIIHNEQNKRLNAFHEKHPTASPHWFVNWQMSSEVPEVVFKLEEKAKDFFGSDGWDENILTPGFVLGRKLVDGVSVEYQRYNTVGRWDESARRVHILADRDRLADAEAQDAEALELNAKAAGGSVK